MENGSSAYAISHEPLGKTVADRLRSLILSGELPAGHHLKETDLAAKMGVSRGPIREAIAKLEHEGFVQVVPRQGAFVLEITPDSIHERYEMRRLLEVYAVRRAAELRDPGHLRALEEHVRQTERSIRERDLERFYVSQYQYHREIVQMAEMSLLLRVWDLLASGMGSLMMLNLWYANPGEAFTERVWDSSTASGSVHGHRQLIDVIAQGDAEAAAETLRLHLEQGERSVLKALETARAVTGASLTPSSPVEWTMSRS
jgi:DNA-binding GntR family transcriptional regulator